MSSTSAVYELWCCDDCERKFLIQSDFDIFEHGHVVCPYSDCNSAYGPEFRDQVDLTIVGMMLKLRKGGVGDE